MAEAFKLDITKTAKEVAEQALDDFAYKGLTIRQWADKITAGEYQPVKHGWWIVADDGVTRCSICYGASDYERSFCGDCGAKMDGGERQWWANIK